MHINRKLWLLPVITVFIMIAAVCTAYAGSWECSDGENYRYKKDNGQYCISEWLFDDGFWFHFGTDGLMQTGWISETASESETGDADDWYYLETEHDSPVPYGGCYVDTITPDGYLVNEDGRMEDTGDSGDTSEAIGRRAVGWALDHLGEKYSQSKRMNSGYFDCSSLVYRAYRSMGIDVSFGGDSTSSGIAKRMMADGKIINHKDLQVGDLVFYRNKKSGYMGIGHVAMILSKSPLLVVSASEKAGKVVVDDYLPNGACIYARPGKTVK